MPTLKDVSSRATIRCLPVGLACLLALAAASCGPAPRGAGPVEEGAVASAGQDGPVADPTAERLALMAQAQENSRVSVDRPAGGVRRLPREQAAPELPGEPADAGAIAAGEPESASGPAPAGAGAEPGASDSAGPTTVPAGPPPLSREDVLRALASELESQASASDSPVGALIRLAALELVSGASAGAAPEASNLTPREKQFLESWRELIGAARENLKHESDVRPLADKVVELAERLRAEESIAVADARLCTRIDGFGMFNELSRRDAGGPYVFTAGKPVLFLIYTELVNHAHAPTTRGGAEGFLVSLSQELTLTHASSSGESVVWRRGFEGVSEFSRKKRRDFYTTERVSLPATLGVGAYRLKVSVRDETSGAVAEAVIPIEFVAAGSAPR